METAGPSGAQASIPPNDPRLARCGFAKLQGDGLEFFIRKYEVSMGRTSKNSTLDLILGDNSTLSRQHATIKYNFETKNFELIVLGKNGVSVESSANGALHLYTPDSPPTPLRSRDLLIMGERRMYFLLPRSMNVPSRKRRRLEPSPAPGADTTSAQPPGTPQLSAPVGHAPVPPAQQPQLPAHTQHAGGVQPHPQELQQNPQAVQAAVPAAGPAQGGGEPPAQQHQAHQQEPHQMHPQAQPHPQQVDMPFPQDGPGGGGGVTSTGLHLQQFDSLADEDDALISGGGLPYDNGTAYGYDAGNNGFPGEF